MSDIPIGSVKGGQVVVRDANNDGVFNKGDQVCIKDERGAVDCDPTRVNNAMKQLGVSRPYRGVQINAYGGYFEFLRQAQKAASNGDTQETSRLIENARNYARSAGVPVDEGRLERIRLQLDAKIHIIRQNLTLQFSTREGDGRFSIQDLAREGGQSEIKVVDKIINGYVKDHMPIEVHKQKDFLENMARDFNITKEEAAALLEGVS